jgi:hypothetical protein
MPPQRTIVAIVTAARILRDEDPEKPTYCAAPS